MDIKQELTVIIVDDEPEACSNLANLIRTYIKEKINILSFAFSTIEAERKIKLLKPDVVFFDIHMPGENAFQFLERITTQEFQVVFVTAFDNFAIKAFRLNAVDYLLKPIDIGELRSAVSKLIEKQHLLKYKNSSSNIPTHEHLKSQKDYILIKTKSSIDKVDVSHIFFIKALGSYSKIHYAFNNINKQAVVSFSLADYEEILPSKIFYRIHKSYLINTIKIESIEREPSSRVILTNKHILPISRRRISDFICSISNNKII